ncbi:hypothetical protein HY948_00015 [Candidatus Gottesmanbacteria bacterium]|nr:hypothetical protein [Candidatus Gottesmanbacteria bacterium]
MQQVFAQSLTLPGGTTISGPVSWATDIGKIINRAVPYVFAFAGMGLLLMLLAAGFDYLTSAGDEKKLETAKQRLTNALIGFLVVFTAFWLVQIASKIFGLTEAQSIFR